MIYALLMQHIPDMVKPVSLRRSRGENCTQQIHHLRMYETTTSNNVLQMLGKWTHSNCEKPTQIQCLLSLL